MWNVNETKKVVAVKIDLFFLFFIFINLFEKKKKKSDPTLLLYNIRYIFL